MIRSCAIRWVLTVAVALLLATAAVAQPLTLRLIDSEDGLPISACHVLVGDSAIASTNSQGEWIVPQHLRNSNITLSHVSYGQQPMNLAVLPNGMVDIALQPQGYSISEVKVKGKHKKVKLNKMGIIGKKSENQNIFHSAFWIPNNKIFAVYIENTEIDIDYEIQQLFIYINPTGIPTAPFLITLCEAQAPHVAPDTTDKVLYGPLLTHAERGGAYHRINLAHIKKKMPKGGLYVVLRNCPTNAYEDRPPITIDGYKISSGKVNHAVIGQTYGKYKNKFLHWEHRTPLANEKKFFADNNPQWIRDTIRVTKNSNGGISIHGEPMIYVTLKKSE